MLEKRPVEPAQPVVTAPKEELSDSEMAELKRSLERLESIIVEGRARPTDYSKELAQAETDADRRRQSTEYLAQGHYEAALQQYKEFEFAKAKDTLEMALRSDPNHQEAKRLLRDVQMALGERTGELAALGHDFQNRLVVLIQQTQMEVNNHFKNGERLMAEGKYTEAIGEFTKVEEKIAWSPYDIGLGDRFSKRTAEYLKVCREKSTAEEAARKQAQLAAAEAIVRAEEEKRKQAIAEHIATLMKRAIAHFDNKEYSKAEILADEVLKIAPNMREAQELRNDALQARHVKRYADHIKLRRERWLDAVNKLKETLIPYAEDALIRYPDPAYWTRVLERAERVGVIAEEEAEDPEIIAVKNRLDTLPIDLDFADASLSDIVEFIREYAKVNIEISQEVRREGTADKRISFQVKGLVLKSVLKILLSNYGLDYMFEGKLILITTPELAAGKPSLQVHDVRDLLRTLADFPGPDLELKSVSDGVAGIGAAFAPEEPPPPAISAEQLKKLITDSIEPASWTERQDVSCELSSSGQLLVVHTPQVQQQIKRFLDKLRSFTGSMVSIEARFLKVDDDFLEHVGFEWRSDPNAPPIGTPPTGAVWGPNYRFNDTTAAQPTDSGFWSQPGNAGGPNAFGTHYSDFRFRTQLPMTDSTGNPLLGNMLSPRGGLGMVVNVLEDWGANIVMRAVRKKEMAVTLNAPRVTVFNTQRAHLLVAQQRAYIQDYDVQISTDARAYDPIIGYIQFGLALDVRAIVSNDRKYITLELRPGMSENIQMRKIDIARGNEIREVWIQLPQVRLQRAMTTVRMPDKGTILIGGLKNVLDHDIEESTPFLSRIPIVGELFRVKRRIDEKRMIIILVRAEIIDTSELEEGL
jgi:general secretion pathway protein D